MDMVELLISATQMASNMFRWPESYPYVIPMEVNKSFTCIGSAVVGSKLYIFFNHGIKASVRAEVTLGDWFPNTR